VKRHAHCPEAQRCARRGGDGSSRPDDQVMLPPALYDAEYSVAFPRAASEPAQPQAVARISLSAENRAARPRSPVLTLLRSGSCLQGNRRAVLVSTANKADADAAAAESYARKILSGHQARSDTSSARTLDTIVRDVKSISARRDHIPLSHVQRRSLNTCGVPAHCCPCALCSRRRWDSERVEACVARVHAPHAYCFLCSVVCARAQARASLSRSLAFSRYLDLSTSRSVAPACVTGGHSAGWVLPGQPRESAWRPSTTSTARAT
jgi:hypothetical protein